jgi:hypothetical protein
MGKEYILKETGFDSLSVPQEFADIKMVVLIK